MARADETLHLKTLLNKFSYAAWISQFRLLV